MRLAQMGCATGVRKKQVTEHHGAEINSEGVHVRSTFFVKILGPNFGLMLLTLKLRFIVTDYVQIKVSHLWLDENVFCSAWRSMCTNASTSFAKWLKAWACTMHLNEDYDRFDRTFYKPIKIIECHKEFARIFIFLCEIAKRRMLSSRLISEDLGHFRWTGSLDQTIGSWGVL